MVAENKAKTVHFKLTRRIGDDTVEFNLSSYAAEGEVSFVFNSLMGEVRSALTDYMQNVAPTLPSNPTGENSKGQTWVEIERLTVSIDKGKRYVKAHGGKFQQYGLVIWPEVAKKISLDLSLIPDTGYIPHTPLLALVGTDSVSGKFKLLALKIGGE